ncbi:MAG: hypothetical protein V8Q88_06315 [Christensenellales bacterium]
MATVKSEAEIALENFMEKWRKGIVADMVEYTAKSWQDSLSDQPSQQLFWKFAQKPLLDWRQMAAPTGTDESNGAHDHHSGRCELRRQGAHVSV